MGKRPEEFDVQKESPTKEWISYRKFIETLRESLGAERFSHNLPVLPLQHNPPTEWFDIVLQTDSHSITLRIRRDNLYLDAYRMENSERWLEFGSDTTSPPSPHLISGSSFLGFDGGYVGLESVAGASMSDINLGQQQLIGAVNQLAISNDPTIRARSLIIVIQMICESIRFSKISNHLAREFNPSSPPPEWIRRLEHGWEDLSAALLHADADPNNFFRLPRFNDLGIVTAADAVAVLGILLGLSFRRSALRRVARMADNDEQRALYGRPLVEVFWVRIDKIDGEDPGDLYGTIKVTDGLGSQYIYNRTKDEPESINLGHTALLTGPARSISAYGSFTVDVDLMNKNRWLSDHVVSKGQISWNVFNTTNEYDKPLFHKVDGEHGSVTVNYAVLSNAVEATMEATLVNGDGEDPAHVYGNLTARYNYRDFTDENQSVLYRKASNEHIDVRPGDLIPLSRSVVAVPLDSTLTVSADLQHHNTILSDREIAKGTAEFPAEPHGNSTSEEFNISGEYGSVRVNYLSDAVEATVEVTLINGDGEDPAHVYGNLITHYRYGQFEDENKKMLFQKTSSERIDVRPWELIPLSRSVITVPWPDSTLIVSADLWHHNTILSDREIAKGTVEFHVKQYGTSEEFNISGEHGQIRVKVTWK